MKHYTIAELSVQMDPQHAPLLPRAIPYLSEGDGSSDCVLAVSEETVQYYLNLYPGVTRDVIEYMVIGSQFYSHLIERSGLMLHASAVELDGKAYLFSAPSGTGKSTHTSLWVEEFSPRARIINDDKPAIRILPDGIYVYGTPWSGKSDLNQNIKVPLQGITFISRGEENHIEPADSKFSITNLLKQTIRPKENEARFSLLLGHIDNLVKRVPIYKMRCNMNPEAAHLSYKFMSKGVVK